MPKNVVSKQYSKVVRCDVYNESVLFVVGGSAMQAAEKLAEFAHIPKEKRAEFTSSVTEGSLGKALFSPNSNGSAIWLPALPTTCTEMGTVAHECLHIVADMMANRGVEWTVHGEGLNRWVNDEPFCYLLGFFVREFLAFSMEVQDREKARRRRISG